MIHRQPDAVQDFLQGFGLGFGLLALAATALRPGWGALIGEQIDVDELEGAHLVVEFPCPGAHWRLVDDVDDVAFL